MTPNIDSRALRRQFRSQLWRSLRVVRPILVALLVAPVLVLLSYVIGPAHFSLHRRRQSGGTTHLVMSPPEWMRRPSVPAPRQRFVLRTARFSVVSQRSSARSCDSWDRGGSGLDGRLAGYAAPSASYGLMPLVS